jgi:hypothetical protein
MRFYDLTLGLLAVWRITHLLAAEDGPGEILARLRRLAGSGFWGRLLDCFLCLSLWAAAPVAWLLARGVPSVAASPGGGQGVAASGGPAGSGGWALAVLLWLALSAGAILIERLAQHPAGPGPMPIYEEDPQQEHEHVMLRQSEKPGGGEPVRRPPES